MDNLYTFLDSVNRIRSYVGQKAINLSLITQAEAQELCNQLVSSLTPEILTMDGELKPAEVNRRRRLFTKALAELKQFCLEKGIEVS